MLENLCLRIREQVTQECILECVCEHTATHCEDILRKKKRQKRAAFGLYIGVAKTNALQEIALNVH